MRMAKIVVGVLAAAAVAGGAAAQDETEMVGAWKLTSVIDPITDQGRMIASIEADGGMLAVKCDAPGSDSVYIHWVASDYLGGRGGRFASRQLTYRFDQNAPVTEVWSYDGRSAIQTNGRAARAFSRSLVAAQRVVVRGSDYRGSEKTSVFTLTPDDTQAAIARVYQTCEGAPL